MKTPKQYDTNLYILFCCYFTLNLTANYYENETAQTRLFAGFANTMYREIVPSLPITTDAKRFHACLGS